MGALQENFTKALEEKQTAFEGLQKELHKKEQEHEELLSQSYNKMRELSQKNAQLIEESERLQRIVEERLEAQSKLEQESVKLQTALQNAKVQGEEQLLEIRKAHSYLAKKVKEATILRDLSERQRVQIEELEESRRKQQHEIERMQNSLSLQKMHEEKLQLVAEEWQEKYRDLLKIKKQHEHMVATFAELKSLFAKSSDVLSEE